MTEPTPEPTATEHRGRPRPQGTIERDEQVYQLLLSEGPLSRTQIAEKMSVKPSIAYMSLFRLHRDGYVERQAGSGENAKSHTWAAIPK